MGWGVDGVGMDWPHALVWLGALAGIIASYLIALLMAYRPHPTLLGALLIPGDSLDDTIEHKFLPAVLAQLLLGAAIGAAYTWTLHTGVDLPNRWITDLPYTVASGLGVGAILAVLAVLTTAVGVLKYPIENRWDYAFLATALLLYGALLGLIVGGLRPYWYDILLV